MEKKTYTLDEAIEFLKNNSKAKFDETVEIVIRLGIDPKKTEQKVRGVVSLPHGIGKNVRVAVITKGENVEIAKQAGADIVGYQDLIEKISQGEINFDVLIATPDTMKDIAKLGKILGPKKLLPNPKSGTVTTDLLTTIKQFKTGQIEFRSDAYGIIHCAVGKISFPAEKLKENINALLKAVNRAKPAGVKGKFMKRIFISSTMGPGLEVNL